MATIHCKWNSYDYEWEHIVDEYGDDNDNNEPGFKELKNDIIDYLKNTPEGRKRILVTAKEMKCEPSDLEDGEIYNEIVENAMNDILDYDIKYRTIDDDDYEGRRYDFI